MQIHTYTNINRKCIWGPCGLVYIELGVGGQIVAGHSIVFQIQIHIQIHTSTHKYKCEQEMHLLKGGLVFIEPVGVGWAWFLPVN